NGHVSFFPRAAGTGSVSASRKTEEPGAPLWRVEGSCYLTAFFCWRGAGLSVLLGGEAVAPCALIRGKAISWPLCLSSGDCPVAELLTITRNMGWPTTTW